jgi:hypothetical protein
MASIKLTKGYEAIVDDKDCKRLNAFSWYAALLHSVYAARASRKHEWHSRYIVFLHHQVLDVMPWELEGQEIDHINRNTLDCREENLRLVTHAVNMQNSKTSLQRRGVAFDRTHLRWKAYLDRPGKNRINLGTVGTEEEALVLVATAREQYQ